MWDSLCVHSLHWSVRPIFDLQTLFYFPPFSWIVTNPNLAFIVTISIVQFNLKKNFECLIAFTFDLSFDIMITWDQIKFHFVPSVIHVWTKIKEKKDSSCFSVSPCKDVIYPISLKTTVTFRKLGPYVIITYVENLHTCMFISWSL